MTLKNSKLTGVDEAIEESDKVLKKWEGEAVDETEAVSVSLLRAVNPGWCRWLKESGATSRDIIEAVINLSAALTCEVVGNVTDEDKYKALGEGIADHIKAKIMFGVENMDNAMPLPGFRRTDS